MAQTGAFGASGGSSGMTSAGARTATSCATMTTCAANTIGADKYFRCKANFEATQRGSYGAGRAAVISDVREWTDQHVKGDPASASAADQQANHWGRAAASAHPDVMGREACDRFRSKGLDARY